MPYTTASAPHAPRDPALDGLRGVAVLLIYLFHYGGGLTSSHLVVRIFGMLTASGWIGVQMFFALSGFLITNILWSAQQTPRVPHWLRNFYARRALRIFPLFYLALVAAFLVTVVHMGSFSDARPLRPEFFFLQDIAYFARPAEFISALPIFHLWSLAVEEQFYLLWPLLLLLCRTRRSALVLCVTTILLSLAFCVLLYSPYRLVAPSTADAWNRFLLTNAGGLATGALVAIATPARLDRFAPAALTGGLLAFLLSSYQGHSFSLAHPHQMFLALPGIWIASAALVPLVLRPGRARRWFSNRILRFLGRISFGIYVFHLLLEPVYTALAIRLAHAAVGYLYLGTRMCLALPLTVVVAWVSFQLYEFPFLKLKRHFPVRLPS
jgi:peptidoglycan/LPS O-acetylase OafA/YrhL